jgi:hypothetical protein
MSTIPLNSAAAAEAAPAWSRRTRLIVSSLLALHLAAMAIGPLSVEPTSDMSRSAWSVFRPYLEVAYLNHGWHFFAPEPGPSHLIRYELTRADGSVERGFFPDRGRHSPRLLYHRHFMLTEHLNAMADSGVSPEVIDAFCRSFAQHLMAEHEAEGAKLYMLRHFLPGPEDVRQGISLTDSRYYRERLLGSFARQSDERLASR